MYDVLNVSGVTATIDTYDSDPAIFIDNLMPQDFEGDGINFYLSSYDPRVNVDIYEYIINCRASTHEQSRLIANAVETAVNRKFSNNCFTSCVHQSTIPPMDDRDDYNSIIYATLKKRS